MQSITNNSSHSTLHIDSKEKYIEETNNTKFLVSEINNHIKWKNHIKQGISMLNAEDYANRSAVHISNVHCQINVLCLPSFCYKIWNDFGGSSSYRGKNSTLQNKIVSIMSQTDWCKQKPTITPKPAVLQASLGPTNMQDNTEPIKNVSTEALQIFH
jgi:hypothetical protein